MLSIKNNVKNEINIKRSKFICHLYKINSTEEAKEIIDNINLEYKDATHNCYAYICGVNKKYSDDGEPSGTAGAPMLNILEVQELDNILAIVTRYFGGIKLGANGLVHAYLDSVKLALEQSEIISLINGIEIEITFNYDNTKQIDYLLKDEIIISKEYNNEIKYIIHSKDDIKDKLGNLITSYKFNKNVLIEKKD